MKKSLIIVILFVLGFLFNSNIVEWIYPNAANDYNEFLKYYDLRNKIYSLLFLLPFIYILYNYKSKLIRSIAVFGLFITFASAFDKIIFNFYQFKASDWIIIGAGIIGGLYVHTKARD